MNDTTIQMQRKQFEIYQSKSIDEKFRMLTDMMEFGINQTQATLKKWYPMKSELELQIEFVKIYYRDDFNSERMDILVNQMVKYAHAPIPPPK